MNQFESYVLSCPGADCCVRLTVHDLLLLGYPVGVEGEAQWGENDAAYHHDVDEGGDDQVDEEKVLKNPSPQAYSRRPVSPGTRFDRIDEDAQAPADGNEYWQPTGIETDYGYVTEVNQVPHGSHSLQLEPAYADSSYTTGDYEIV